MNRTLGSSDLLKRVLQALRFDGSGSETLQSLPEEQWPALLDLTDRTHLTLALGARYREFLPPAAQARIEGCLSRNAVRHQNMQVCYRGIAAELEKHSIEFIMLKGLAQWPWYTDDPRHRTQSDIDLYCPCDSVLAASVLGRLGYEQVSGSGDTRTDHLPIMIRRTGWRWRGDYFDPDMPPAIELHYRFWDAVTEGFDLPGVDRFWPRRVVRDIGGISVPTLNLADGLTYSAMHTVRHLLRGDLHPRHIYEIAHFLDRSAEDDAFWTEWNSLSGGRNTAEAIAFRLAQEFAPRMHPGAAETANRLSAPVARWFRLFGFSAATAAVRPNKDELWLHLCLVESPAARRVIAIRRLLPSSRSPVLLDPHVKPGRTGVGLLLRRKVFAGRFHLQRAWFHARALIAFLRSGVRWLRAGVVSS